MMHFKTSGCDKQMWRKKNHFCFSHIFFWSFKPWQWVKSWHMFIVKRSVNTELPIYHHNHHNWPHVSGYYSWIIWRHICNCHQHLQSCFRFWLKGSLTHGPEEIELPLITQLISNTANTVWTSAGRILGVLKSHRHSAHGGVLSDHR